MSDDFFDDMEGMDDNFGDPSDDFQEDLFDEYDDGLNDLAGDAGSELILPDESVANNTKSIVMGGMIAGQAFSEAKFNNGQERLRRQMQTLDKRRK